MSKFQDLLNGRIPQYSEAFIIPVASLCEMGLVNEKENFANVKARREITEKEAIDFAKQNEHKAVRVAVGYPLYNDGWWIYKVWTR